MSTSTVKDNRKRVIEQSSIKKIFKDSTITKEDLDGAIVNGIKLALREQQSTLDSVVASTLRDAIDSVLTPVLRDLQMDIEATNNSVKELKAEVEKLAIAAKQTRDRVDSFQAAAPEDRRTVTNLRNQLEQLTDKVTNMKDRSRRNNVRLVRLPEGVKGSDAAGFLRDNLSKWIPALKGRDIEIEQAHRMYDGRKSNSEQPHTLVFRVLTWQDRSAILKGARQTYPVKYMQDNVTLLFFPDFSPATSARRRKLNPVLRRKTPLGLQLFLIYPVIIKLRHNGEQCFLLFFSESRGFYKLTATEEGILTAQERRITGEHGHLSFCCDLLSCKLV
uniref:LINE-1 type transposase domain-containing 1 n=1 Tax=Cyprinus carpio TaxID=7962 RepID=A0A8C2JZV1_CYPCA